MRRSYWFALFFCLVCLANGRTTSAYTPPPLDWKTLETEHFMVHYHVGAEWTARKVAEIAEEVHGPLCALYQFEPGDKTNFVVKDTHDYANGAAYFFDNKVEIWATNLEFGFRGTTQWLRNVVTHEYAHMISIQASTKMPNWMPAMYFQMVTFEDEKRPDVLQGYPKDIISYPFSAVNMPPWFAEGVAQYMTPDYHYDCWDAHRDMILRSAVLEDKMLTYEQMGFFGKTGLKSEQVYDHGYGLVSYIAREYGHDALRETAEGLKKVYRFNVDGALKEATGKKGRELYDEWKADLELRYAAQTADIEQNLRIGKLLDGEGYMTVAPAFSPDGERIVYLSNKGQDYSLASLYIMDRDGTDGEALKGAVSSPPRYAADGKKVIYSRKVQIDRHGSRVNDLFVFDLATEKEERLTESSRYGDPSYSRDGTHILAVHNSDGTHRMVRLDADGKNAEEVFAGPSGAQIYAPQYSPDGSRILFGYFEGATREIATVAADGSDFQYILQTASDERDARWARDGRSIVFSSDRSGIFNVFELDVESGNISQLSNVIGGAFNPELSPNGKELAYAGYGGDGYGLYGFELPAAPVETMDVLAYGRRTAGEFDECRVMREADIAEHAAAQASLGDGIAVASTDGATLGGLTGQSDATEAAAENVAAAQQNLAHALEPGDYKPAYSPFQLYPRLMIWDGKARFGAFMTSYELLDKQNLFVGGAYGVNNEYDGYLLYEMRHLLPVIYADFLVLRERTSDYTVDEDIDSATRGHAFDFNVRYDLWQADIGLRLELGETFSLVAQHDVSLYYTHAEYSVNIDGKEYDEAGDFLQSFDGGWKYYVGNQITLQYLFRGVRPATDSSINPRGGRYVMFSYMRAFDQLFSSGQFEYGFRPQFDDNNYGQATIDWREFIAMPWFRHSVRLRLWGSVIDDTVDDFFWVYAGGRDYLRGYTYYSIGGRKATLLSLTYRFPILRNLDKQLLHLYFRDFYGGVFVETGNAWAESGFQLDGYKTSAGYELRMNLGSYYVFPTAISLLAAYSFDPIATVLRDGSDERIPIVFTQDSGWTYYFSMGFAFDM